MEEKDWKKDFVDETPIEIKIDNRIFKYKPATGEDENNWLNHYVSTNKEGQTEYNYTELNKCKLRNVIDIPYPQEAIKEILGLDKSWNSLDIEMRYKFLGKLNPILLTRLVKEINKIDDGLEIKKKSK